MPKSLVTTKNDYWKLLNRGFQYRYVSEVWLITQRIYINRKKTTQYLASWCRTNMAEESVLTSCNADKSLRYNAAENPCNVSCCNRRACKGPRKCIQYRWHWQCTKTSYYNNGAKTLSVLTLTVMTIITFIPFACTIMKNHLAKGPALNHEIVTNIIYTVSPKKCHYFV